MSKETEMNSEASSKWEFDCPQYVDFQNTFDDEEDGADGWFGRTKDDTNVRTIPNFKPHLTIPLTPNLKARFRNRRHHVISLVDKEEKEVEEMKKYNFRARPLKTSVMKGADAAKIENAISTQGKPLTVPRTPAITRVKSKRPHQTNNENVNSQDQEKIINTLKSSAKKIKRTRSSSSESNVVYPGIPFVTKQESSITIPQPFSFDEVDKVRLTRKNEKIQKAIEDERKLHEFKANPLPKLSPQKLPSVKAIPSTKVKPFNLESLARHQVQVEKWGTMMNMKAVERKEKMEFKANPLKKSSPFIPERSRKPLTVPNVNLYSERRSQDRKAYDEYLIKKDAQLQILLKEREQEKKVVEKNEIMELRSKLVHRAKPFQNGTPMKPQPSSFPLTIPVTPLVAKRKGKSHSASSLNSSSMDCKNNTLLMLE